MKFPNLRRVDPVSLVIAGAVLLGTVAAPLVFTACKRRIEAADVKLVSGLSDQLDLSKEPDKDLVRTICGQDLALVFVGNAESLGDLKVRERASGKLGDQLIRDWKTGETSRQWRYFTLMRQRLAALASALGRGEDVCPKAEGVQDLWGRLGRTTHIDLFAVLDGPNVVPAPGATYQPVDRDGLILSWQYTFVRSATTQLYDWQMTGPKYWTLGDDGNLTSSTPPPASTASSAPQTPEQVLAQLTAPPAPAAFQEFYVPDAVVAVDHLLSSHAYTQRIHLFKGHGGTLQARPGFERVLESARNPTRGSVFMFDPHGPRDQQTAPDFYSILWSPEQVCRSRVGTNQSVAACAADIRSEAARYAAATRAADLAMAAAPTNGSDGPQGNPRVGQGNPKLPQGTDPKLPQGSDPKLPQGADPRTPQGADPRMPQGADPRMPQGADPRSGGQGDPRNGGQSAGDLTLGEGFWGRDTQGVKNLVFSNRQAPSDDDATGIGRFYKPVSPTSPGRYVTSDRIAADLGDADATWGRPVSRPVAFRLLGRGLGLSTQTADTDVAPLHLAVGVEPGMAGVDALRSPTLVLFDTCFASMAPLAEAKTLPWLGAEVATSNDVVVLSHSLPLLEDALTYGELDGFQYVYLAHVLQRGIAAANAQPFSWDKKFADGYIAQARDIIGRFLQPNELNELDAVSRLKALSVTLFRCRGPACDNFVLHASGGPATSNAERDEVRLRLLDAAAALAEEARAGRLAPTSDEHPQTQELKDFVELLRRFAAALQEQTVSSTAVRELALDQALSHIAFLPWIWRVHGRAEAAAIGPRLTAYFDRLVALLKTPRLPPNALDVLLLSRELYFTVLAQRAASWSEDIEGFTRLARMGADAMLPVGPGTIYYPPAGDFLRAFASSDADELAAATPTTQELRAFAAAEASEGRNPAASAATYRRIAGALLGERPAR